MVSRRRLKRCEAKRPFKMMVDGKLFSKVSTEEEYSRLVAPIDRKKHKVRLV